ncbi:hypothetical protein ACGFJT_36770 [Actinomadura geliboluensis]|uniref:Mom family adenine methylcarbamoylation protein n=1 Tax=Actinomadura geliboluensis TaxID=882440 RepID=UPI00372058E5
MTGPGALLVRGQLMLPADTPWCQRSGPGRVHSWRHRSDGGFASASFAAARVDEATARSFVLDRHYSGTYPAGRLQYGMYRVSGPAPELVGVAVLSVPMNVKTLTGPFPRMTPYAESVELGRFVLADQVPGNGESWFIGRIAELAAADGVRGIVAFSDPFGRTRLDGSVVFPGHVGTIYQAANFGYFGRGTPRTLALLPDGSVLSARALSKVRRDEQGHQYVERQLVAHGADPRPDGMPGALWLPGALRQARVRPMRHGGNHRYCLAIGPRRRRIRPALPPSPYPKHTTPAPERTTP